MPLSAHDRETLARGSVEEVRELMDQFRFANWDTGHFEWTSKRDEIEGHMEAVEKLQARACAKVGGDLFRCWAVELHARAELMEADLWDRWHGQESFSV